MPIYNFATYVQAREEWAIRADDPDHARALIGDDPSGDWLDDALYLDAEPIERRDEFAPDASDDDLPAIEEITPDHWAWRDAHREFAGHSVMQNIAAISGEFHTHRRYWEFYEAFGTMIDGFVGQYELCIAMGEALTDWELGNGVGQAYENAGAPWIEVVEDFVDAMLEAALAAGVVPDPAETLLRIRALARR
jgi:hypothetical protein